jgi:ABC-type glycerol-3-phosphate transport system substrate-binding protein
MTVESGYSFAAAPSTSRRAMLGKMLGVGGALIAAACTPAGGAAPTPLAKATEPPKPNPAAPTSVPAAATAVPAAAAKSVSEIVFTNYSTGADRGIWEQTAAEFTKKNPQYAIKYTPVAADSWGEYFDKLATLIAGGNPPDISRVAIEGALLFVAKGLAQPYDDLMKGDKDIEDFKKDVNDRLWNTFQVEGKQYAFPFDWNNMVVFYNVDHLKEAGLAEPTKDWTYDQFLDYAKKLTKRPSGGGDPERYGFGFAIQYFSAAMPWIFNAGSNLLSDDWSKSNANDPKLIEAITFMRDLVWEHKVSPQPPANNNDNQNLFVSGKISMMGGGRWPVLFLEQQNFKGNYNIVAWPKWRDQVTEFGVGGFPILKASKKIDASYAWAKYLTTKEPFNYQAGLGSSIPSRRSVGYDDSVMKKGPQNWKLYYDSIEAPNARPVPAPPEYNVVESIFRRYLSTTLANEQPPDAAMQAAHKEISDLLAKRPKEWNVKSALLK